jgi:hypothetical protein
MTRWRANTATVFNVLFKELIVLTKCETSDKDACASRSSSGTKYDDHGAPVRQEFDLTTRAGGHALPSVRESDGDDARRRT